MTCARLRLELVPTTPCAGPQLFEATLAGQPAALVAAGEKSGVYYAFDRATGGVVWATTVGYGSFGGIHAETAIGDGTIYVWNKHHAQSAAVPAAVYLANDVYCVGSLDGVIRAYRASDGEQV